MSGVYWLSKGVESIFFFFEYGSVRSLWLRMPGSIWFENFGRLSHVLVYYEFLKYKKATVCLFSFLALSLALCVCQSLSLLLPLIFLSIPLFLPVSLSLDSFPSKTMRFKKRKKRRKKTSSGNSIFCVDKYNAIFQSFFPLLFEISWIRSLVAVRRHRRIIYIFSSVRYCAIFFLLRSSNICQKSANFFVFFLLAEVRDGSGKLTLRKLFPWCFLKFFLFLFLCPYFS